MLATFMIRSMCQTCDTLWPGRSAQKREAKVKRGKSTERPKTEDEPGAINECVEYPALWLFQHLHVGKASLFKQDTRHQRDRNRKNKKRNEFHVSCWNRKNRNKKRKSNRNNCSNWLRVGIPNRNFLFQCECMQHCILLHLYLYLYTFSNWWFPHQLNPSHNLQALWAPLVLNSLLGRVSLLSLNRNQIEICNSSFSLFLSFFLEQN